MPTAQHPLHCRSRGCPSTSQDQTHTATCRDSPAVGTNLTRQNKSLEPCYHAQTKCTSSCTQMGVEPTDPSIHSAATNPAHGLHFCRTRKCRVPCRSVKCTQGPHGWQPLFMVRIHTSRRAHHDAVHGSHAPAIRPATTHPHGLLPPAMLHFAAAPPSAAAMQKGQRNRAGASARVLRRMRSWHPHYTRATSGLNPMRKSSQTSHTRRLDRQLTPHQQLRTSEPQQQQRCNHSHHRLRSTPANALPRPLSPIAGACAAAATAAAHAVSLSLLLSRSELGPPPCVLPSLLLWMGLWEEPADT